MSVLRGLERRLQGAVGNTFARLFGGKVKPAEVAAALQSEATSQARSEGEFVVIPNHFIVHLGPSDHAEVTADSQQVSRALTDMLRDYAADSGWSTYGDVAVNLEQSPRLHTGQFRIESLIDPDVGRASAGAGIRHKYDENRAHGQVSSASSGAAAGVVAQQGMTPPYDAASSHQPPAPPYGTQQRPHHAAYPGGAQPGPGFTPAGAAALPASGPPTPQPAGPTGLTPAGLPPVAVLVVDDGSARVYPLQRGSNIVGRGSDAQLRIADTSVSRQHADVYFDGQLAVIHDLGSTNGTLVNGTVVQAWQLAHGDVIRVGQASIVFQIR